MTRPGFLAHESVRLAVRVLPAGSTRDRYEQEFIAEMYAISPKCQKLYAIGVLTHAWSLRAALAENPLVSEEREMQGKPLMCRLNVRHRWRWDSTEDGQRYEHCAKCGKDRADFPEDPSGGGLIGRGLAMPAG